MISSINVKKVIFRKLIHVLLTLILLPPLITDIQVYLHLTPTQYYALCSIGALTIYILSLKIRTLGLINQISLNMSSFIKRYFSSISTQYLTQFTIIMQNFVHRVENVFKELMEYIVRDYEIKYGYLGLVAGAVSVFCSYVLFNKLAILGILALLIYDSLSAIFGTLIGRHRIPFSTVSIEGCLIAGTIYAIALHFILNITLPIAIILALVAIVIEAYLIEDNLMYPLLIPLAYKLLTS